MLYPLPLPITDPAPRRPAHDRGSAGLGQGVQHIDFEAFDHNGNKIDELSDSARPQLAIGPTICSSDRC